MPPPAEGIASRLILGPALGAQPDRRLVSLVREGYEAAFEEIVRRYGRPLARYAATIVGGRCEDVTQDAFSKALLALRRNDAEIDLRPWLFRIVRNTALNDLRDSPPSPEALAEAIAGGRDPTEELEQREALADLMRKLRALPEPQRAAIVMRELEGLGHDEIAAALGLSGGAARQAIYRARQALRSGLGMLVPLPLLKVLLAGAGTGTAEAAAGTAGVGGVAGAGIALKATAATVLVAGAVGAGVAIDRTHRAGHTGGAAEARQSGTGGGRLEALASPPAATRSGGDSELRRSGSGSGEGRSGREAGDDRGRRGDGRGSSDDRTGGDGAPHRSGDGGAGSGGGDDHRETSGQGPSDRSGHEGAGTGEGPGSGGEGSGPDDGSSQESNSGPSGGSGSGDDGGHGSGSGESGSEESGSGGSGSGDSSDSHDASGLTEQTAPEP